MYPSRKTYDLIHVPRDVILYIASAKMAPFPWFPILLCFFFKTLFPSSHRVPSLETQGADSGGERKSKRTGKYGTKKSKEKREEPLGTMSYQTSLKFSGTNQQPGRLWPFGSGLVRRCPQGLFSPFFTFLRAIFSHSFRLSLAPHYLPLGLHGCSRSRRSKLAEMFLTGRCKPYFNLFN